MRRWDEDCRTCRQHSSRALAAVVRRTSCGSCRAATTRTHGPSRCRAARRRRSARTPARAPPRPGSRASGAPRSRPGFRSRRWNARRRSATRPARRPRPASGRRRRRRPRRQQRRRSASPAQASWRARAAATGPRSGAASRASLGRGRGPALRLAPRRRLAGSALRLARAFASRRSLRCPGLRAAATLGRLPAGTLAWARLASATGARGAATAARRAPAGRCATGRALVGALVAVAGTEHLGADLERQRGEPHRELEGGAGNGERVHECLLFVLPRKPGGYPPSPRRNRATAGRGQPCVVLHSFGTMSASSAEWSLRPSSRQEWW